MIGSPVQSNIPLPEVPFLRPPVRDPYVATEEWRNNVEADNTDRGAGRRRRPGVVFDIPEVSRRPQLSQIFGGQANR